MFTSDDCPGRFVELPGPPRLSLLVLPGCDSSRPPSLLPEMVPPAGCAPTPGVSGELLL
jgi:hypothetical protein